MVWCSACGWDYAGPCPCTGCATISEHAKARGFENAYDDPDVTGEWKRPTPSARETNPVEPPDGMQKSIFMRLKTRDGQFQFVKAALDAGACGVYYCPEKNALIAEYAVE